MAAAFGTPSRAWPKRPPARRCPRPCFTGSSWCRITSSALPWQQDDRLWRLWEKVSANVGHDWTLYELAADAHVSAEPLRRLCRRSLGRSPMHHVTWLRMRKAAELLSTTPLKVETIAHAVGYQNPFVFSNTFKKWIGWRPSEHRSSAR